MEHGLSQRGLRRHPHRPSRPPCRDRPDRGRLLPAQGSQGGSGEEGKGARRPAPPAIETRPPKPPRTAYTAEVLWLYCLLPDTLDRPRPLNRRLAAELERRGVPLDLIHGAFLLATARRLFSPGAPLPPIRSLHYFVLVFEEIQQEPLDPGYVEYLRRRLRAAGAYATPRQRLQTSIFTK